MAESDYSFTRFAQNPFHKEVNECLIERAGVAPGQRIVDLACGTGSVTRQILEKLRGARDSIVIAIDHSSVALRQAVEELGNARDTAVQFVQGQVEKLSEAVKEKVDTVIFCNGIHYIQDKENLLSEVFITLKPGGIFAFNTSFFEGAHPPESEQFYRRWMIQALRTLKGKYGLSPVKAEKVEARKHLTPEQYSQLLEEGGFHVQRAEVIPIQVPIEGWLDISQYEDFIKGIMPGVPLDKASDALKEGVKNTFKALGLQTVPRNWLTVVAVKG